MQDQLFEYRAPKKIVIIGAGFGGLSAALELGKLQTAAKKKKGENIDILVIDKNDYQLFTPELYEIASAAKEYENEEDLKKVVCLNARLALAQKSVGFFHATVEKIDTERKCVITSNGEKEYDYLLISPGSEPFYFNIPGIKEHSIPLKWIDDAVRIRSTIFDTLKEKKSIDVLICGGGPAGVELAAELAHMSKMHPENGIARVTIVDRNSSVLSMLHPRAQKKAMNRLHALGVHMKMGYTITKAEKNAIFSEKEEKLEGDLIVWAGGIKAHSVLEKTGLALTARGQIAVKETLQSKENPEIFVVGDSAEILYDSVPVPQTAHEAIHQGPLAARNIYALIQKKSIEKYVLKNEGFVVTLGGKNGLVALPNNWVFSGKIGWFLRKYVDFRHFRSVLPFMQACSLWYTALKAMNKND